MTALNIDTLRDTCNQVVASLIDSDEPTSEGAWILLANEIAGLALPSDGAQLGEALQAFQRRVKTITGPHSAPRKLNFPEALDWHRTRLNLAQATIADRLLIPRRTWEDWEQGLRVPPEWSQRLILDACARMQA